MLKIIINLIFLFFYILLQVSFLPSLGYPINNLNLILSIIIFVTVIISYEMGLWLAFGLGIVSELYSIFPFGFITISLIITAISINFLFNNFFTNRSLYSLITLGLIGTLIYNILLLITNSFIYFVNLQKNFFDLINIQSLYNLIWQIILNSIILILIFLILNFITKKLKSVFLLPK